MNNLAEWICDMLGNLREESSDIDTMSGLLSFLSEKLPLRFEESDDGFIAHLENSECNCKMLPALTRNTETLCECTNGYQLAMWSEFFGYEIETEIIDTVLRGGKECVFKVKL